MYTKFYFPAETGNATFYIIANIHGLTPKRVVNLLSEALEDFGDFTQNMEFSVIYQSDRYLGFPVLRFNMPHDADIPEDYEVVGTDVSYDFIDRNVICKF